MCGCMQSICSFHSNRHLLSQLHIEVSNITYKKCLVHQTRSPIYAWTMFSRLPPPNDVRTPAKAKLPEAVIQDASIKA